VLDHLHAETSLPPQKDCFALCAKLWNGCDRNDNVSETLLLRQALESAYARLPAVKMR